MTTQYQSNAQMTATYVIDFDRPPSVPEGYSILPEDKQLPNRFKGKMVFDPIGFWCHGTEITENLDYISGRRIFEDLARLKWSVVGAQFLDFLLVNPHLIPGGLQRKMYSAVYFWGTIYLDAFSRRECVRGLRRFGTGWTEVQPKPIDDHWLERYEPAVMISQWCLKRPVS